MTRHGTVLRLRRPLADIDHVRDSASTLSCFALHQLIETLSALEAEPRHDNASGIDRDLPLLLDAVEAGKLLSISDHLVISSNWMPSDLSVERRGCDTPSSGQVEE